MCTLGVSAATLQRGQRLIACGRPLAVGTGTGSGLPDSRVTRSGFDKRRKPVIDNLEGGCACATLRYRLASQPMFVHCCHCRDCQRQTGSAFVLAAGSSSVPTRTKSSFSNTTVDAPDLHTSCRVIRSSIPSPIWSWAARMPPNGGTARQRWQFGEHRVESLLGSVHRHIRIDFRQPRVSRRTPVAEARSQHG